MQRRVFLVSLGAFALVGCRDGSSGPEPPTPSPTPGLPGPLPTPTATVAVPPAPPATPTTEPTADPVPRLLPAGFPIDPALRVGLVTGAVGSRVIRWGEGPRADAYSRDDQPSNDSARANAGGWNARTHFEYEGQPAVDWYLPTGAEVVATMDGTATLLINTVSNPFDVYGVSREAYIGDPDRSRAPISPFPGPGGGQGVFVRIENSEYRTDYAHLEVTPTLSAIPAGAYLEGYGPSFDYAAAFRPLRDFRTATAIARWEVRKGQAIGFTGDSGYSEAPHLHYAIRPAGSQDALCPTTEPGFSNSGSLFRTG